LNSNKYQEFNNAIISATNIVIQNETNVLDPMNYDLYDRCFSQIVKNEKQTERRNYGSQVFKTPSPTQFKKNAKKMRSATSSVESTPSTSGKHLEFDKMDSDQDTSLVVIDEEVVENSEDYNDEMD
jgi:hypothetical protein